ncbi:penicillin-binding transpeptidase domain-containing protein [Actinoplanes sp. N902-109]|uniref:penicillin-binding transpeptidase domain-containing protein n=1 Tax=Actinoplanes sp. (strain N902-109) TaxID=649831 RepID=UPI0003296204|nr:penicillin-binding transpeptidase domain-containing protein [Actinoplanes sp. N902-109]AGL20537.1 penicillin-binding protein transpeptidase [Actinoplanes sp. N902-109]
MHHRAAATLTCLALAATSITACSGSDGPGDTVDAFLAGWRKNDFSDVGFVTAAGSKISADDVAKQMPTLTGDLSKAPLQLATAGKAKETGDNATEPIKLSWTLPGGATWAYQSTVRLTKHNTDGWKVVWEPAIVQSQLTDGDSLELRRKAAERGDILDAAGKPLVTPRPVVTVGVSPERIEDKTKLIKDLGAALKTVGVTIDQDDLDTRLDASAPTAFVDVVTLRRPDYDKVRDKVRSLPGTVFQEASRDLAPTRAFARALLGTVDAATRDDIDKNPQAVAQGDMVGHGGLQEKYDAQLRGTAGQAVVIARRTPDDKVEDGAQIHSVEPVAGTSVKTTLDVRTQNAADAAVAGEKNPSALVAVKISDSSILAVSNGPDGGTVDTALTGQVPPGSTFKMVSALGLLDKKAVTIDTKVDCPATKNVSGREFKNSHDLKLGPVPFRTDFAQSCNTAFVTMAAQLGADGLHAAATEVGLGGGWDLGIDAFSGKVSPADTPTELAAAAFGQGATAVSPVAMAGATAAVARGQFKQPRLVTDPAPKTAADGPPLADTSVKPLRTMMREVVTKGTGDALKSVPGGPVSGKTGTAEFQDGSDQTHSWFIGWQGDIAFAVMVEKGGLGSEAAVPIVKRFLTALT